MTLFNKRCHPVGTAASTLTRERPEDARPFCIRRIDFDVEALALFAGTMSRNPIE